MIRSFNATGPCLLWWTGAPSPRRAATRPWPGSEPHPPRASIKALLITLCEHKESITQLRAFLVDHPLLVLELGFRPVPDAQALYGCDRERTVPCARWLRHWQQQRALPKVDETLAIDVKHICAWVTQNNPKAYVTERFNPQRPPTGDPDCRLDVKKSSNHVQPDGSVKEKKQDIWGYGSGVAAATDPQYGDVVLADYTRPFNEVDPTLYHPLYDRAVVTLGRRPTTVTADAAFDAWHIYETATPEGSAAIPLNLRGHPVPQRQPDSTPLCPTGRPMRPAGAFTHTEG